MVRRRSLALMILILVGLTMAASAGAQQVVAEPVDPLDDPWLSEEGPATPKPLEVPRERVETAWAEAPSRAHARTAALLRTRLEFGLGQLVAPAAVIAGEFNPEEPALYTGLARQLAPGVPSVQTDHALALWRAGDVGRGILTLGAAAWAMATNLPAQLWMLENLAQFLLLVMLATSIAFIGLACFRVFSHAAHDFGDLLSPRMPTFARHAALATLVVAPLVFGEGVLGLLLALFTIAFVYGDGGQRSVLTLAAMLLIIGLHPLARFVAVSGDLLDRDPVVGAVLSVLDGTESVAEVELLESAFPTDLVAAHGVVYRARRQGLEEVSRERMLSILERFPDDAVALGNLGNIEKRRGNTEAAIRHYERAAMLIDSPTLLFNLSQAYATAFRMEEYEATLVRAQEIGDAEVAALSNLDDAEMVADLGYPIGLLRDRLVQLALAEQRTAGTMTALAPGMLGRSWVFTAGAFALVALCSLLLAHRWDHASKCVRCGHRICTRCEETVWSEEICEDCHHLFQYPEATDPSLRMARLQALSERDARLDKVWLALSLMVPGMAGFAARRPDFAIFGLLLFSWAAAWLVWPSGVQADPMLMGSAALLCFAVPGVLAILAYCGLVLFSLVLRKSH